MVRCPVSDYNSGPMVGFTHQPHQQKKKKLPSCFCYKHSLVADDYRHQLISWMLGSVHRPALLSEHGRVTGEDCLKYLTTLQLTQTSDYLVTSSSVKLSRHMDNTTKEFFIFITISLRTTNYTIPCSRPTRTNVAMEFDRMEIFLL